MDPTPLTVPEVQLRYAGLAQIVKALAHPSRLYMVEVLSEGERCVCELQELVGADMSTVSKHLSVLKNVGIVAVEKRGPQVFYHLTVPCVLNFMQCAENVLRARVEEQSACLKCC